MSLKIYNTLTNRLEAFIPINPDRVTFYSCGPTVYDDAHIGNFRSFLAADLLRRWIESPLCALQNRGDSPQSAPRTVTQVMNITDVGHMTDDDSADGAGEDKMEVAARRIAQAKKSGSLPPDAGVDPKDPRAIARFYEQRFKHDAIALGLKVAIDDRDRKPGDPVFMPRATDNIDEMKTVIERLLQDGFAYPAGEPGARAVYFDVQRFADYGRLSGNALDQLKGGAGGRVDQAQQSQKHHPADFLLWKEDASHKMKWDSPAVPGQEKWGKGYPGWHIECTAMALRCLINDKLDPKAINHARIDLHSGGEDNIFPHHECEIAQSRCFTGADAFANYWFHPRFLKVDGQKMSKSKGTMYTLGDLTEKGFDPAAIRLELIKTHYRANADFSIQGLSDSARQIARWRRHAKELSVSISNPEFSSSGVPEQLTRFIDSLNDDLNISGAIAALNGLGVRAMVVEDELSGRTEMDFLSRFEEAVNQVKLPTQPANPEEQLIIYNSTESSNEQRSLAALHLIDNILGVIFRPVAKSQDTGIALYQPGVSPSDEIESLLTQRADAKKAKDFAAADAIRDQLTAMGLAIMDKPGGQVEVAPAN